MQEPDDPRSGFPTDSDKSWITNDRDKRPRPESKPMDWNAVVGILGMLLIICTTIVLLVKL
jgi:hypothetical protein